MCDMVWCCDVVQCQVWNVWCDVEWWWGAWGMCWCAVMQDVKCGCGIPSDVEWFDAILDMVWCGMRVEMQCGMCGVVWNVWCAIYIWMWWCAWCEVKCGCDVEWEPSDSMWNYGVLWNVMCEMLCDVECCFFRHGVMWNAIEMQMCDVEYGMVWTVVSWYVECYIMQEVESYAMWNVVVWNCGDEMQHMQCVVWRQMWKMMQCVVMSDVVVWCKIKMWWCNVMWNMVWCEMCCDVEGGCGVE